MNLEMHRDLPFVYCKDCQAVTLTEITSELDDIEFLEAPPDQSTYGDSYSCDITITLTCTACGCKSYTQGFHHHSEG